MLICSMLPSRPDRLDVEILQLDLTVTKGHLEPGRNAIIAEEEGIRAGEETVVAKHLEDGPVDDRTELDRLVLARGLLCCGEVKRRHGDGAEDVAVVRVGGLVAENSGCLVGEEGVLVPPLSGVAAVDVEHGRLTHLDASNDTLLALGADDFESANRVPGDVCSGGDEEARLDVEATVPFQINSLPRRSLVNCVVVGERVEGLVSNTSETGRAVDELPVAVQRVGAVIGERELTREALHGAESRGGGGLTVLPVARPGDSI
jgi:hypothetical protein